MSAPSPAPAATSTTAVPSAAAREAAKALPPTRVAAADGAMEETVDDIVVHSHDDYDDDDAQPSSGWAALRNKNVSRVLVFCFLDGASHSIWRQDPFQVLIKQLGGDTAVGWMAACSGVTQMAAALVAGYIGNTVQHEVVLRALCGVYSGISATTMEALFADSVATGRRAFVYNLKWMDQVLSSCVGLVICISVLFSLGNQWEQSALVKTMFVGLCLHPVAMSVLWTLRDRYSLREDEEGAAEAVVVLTEVEGREGRVRKSASEVELLHSGLHDDTPCHSSADTRTAATGAIAAAEDTPWSTAQGRPSAIRRNGQDAGSSGSGSGGKRVHWSTTPPAVVDSPAAADSASPTTATAAATGAASPSGRPPRSSRQRAVQCALEESCEAAKQEFFAQLRAAQGNYLLQLRHAASYYGLVIFTWEAVPYLVCLVDFLVAFGSGMTMRYMSLFFVEDYKTTPVVLLTASLLISPLTALISFVVQRMGDLYVGRLPSTIIVRLIGTTLLLLMGVTNLPLNIMLPIYIFRNALMNSTRGITRSVIMDCVRKENRAKWSAFESFSSFTWAGSAVFGGYIAAAHGYKGTFTITAFFHYCSLAVLVPGAIGALPVERELMRSNRTKPHASCLVVTVAVCVIMVIASGFYAWFRSEVAKRNW